MAPVPVQSVEGLVAVAAFVAALSGVLAEVADHRALVFEAARAVGARHSLLAVDLHVDLREKC